MDRLFDHASHPEDQTLLRLAAIELDLERHRRMRRLLVSCASLASMLCWTYARFGVAQLVFAPGLFAFCALSGASLWFWERRLGSKRRHTLARLSAQTQQSIGGGPSKSRKVMTAQCQLEAEREENRRRRRLMTSTSVLLGIAPFLHALAPHFLPSIVRGLSALWSATLCALAAAGTEEVFLWHERRRAQCHCQETERSD